MVEVSRIINANKIAIVYFREKVSPEQLARLVVLNSQGAINVATAKDVLEEMSRTGKDSSEIIQERGLSQISDTSEIGEVVSQVIAANAQAIADFKAGKTQDSKVLVGQVMKATRGRANPKLVNELLEEKLAEVSSIREEG